MRVEDLTKFWTTSSTYAPRKSVTCQRSYKKKLPYVQKSKKSFLSTKQIKSLRTSVFGHKLFIWIVIYWFGGYDSGMGGGYGATGYGYGSDVDGYSSNSSRIGKAYGSGMEGSGTHDRYLPHARQNNWYWSFSRAMVVNTDKTRGFMDIAPLMEYQAKQMGKCILITKLNKQTPKKNSTPLFYLFYIFNIYNCHPQPIFWCKSWQFRTCIPAIWMFWHFKTLCSIDHYSFSCEWTLGHSQILAPNAAIPIILSYLSK